MLRESLLTNASLSGASVLFFLSSSLHVCMLELLCFSLIASNANITYILPIPPVSLCSAC